MDTQQWTISETYRFGEDVLHYRPPEASLVLWRRNIGRDPLIGAPAAGSSGIGEYDYEVGEFVIRYIVVPQQRHVILMTMRRVADMAPSFAERARKGWPRLAEAAAIWGALKWW